MSQFDCPRCGLEADYIPKGRPGGKPVNPRPVAGGVFYQCGVQTSYDDQSGPIYCGDRAVLVADDDAHAGQLFTACARHAEGLRRRATPPAAPPPPTVWDYEDCT